MKITINKTYKYGSRILALLLVFLFIACLKNDHGEPQTADELLIESIANVNFDQLNNDFEIIDEAIEGFGLTEEILKEPNGVRYMIHNLGTGAKPRLTSTIRIKYSGRILSTNVEFDTNDDFETVLLSTIIGFQTTLPLLPEGTLATLFIPSGFAFGPIEYLDQNGDVFIPLNANVVFDVELLEVR